MVWSGNPDTDGDGLTDIEEVALGSDRLSPDTDEDGLMDGEDPCPLNPEALPVYICDGEIPLTQPAALNTNAASDSGGDLRPDIAADASGNWVSVWHSYDSLSGTIGTDHDILVARSADLGATWSAPVALNGNAAVDTGDDHHPHVMTDGAGTWLAVWTSWDDLDGTIGVDPDILISRSDDAGASWSSPVALNSNAPGTFEFDRNPYLATDRAGNWIAVWDKSDTQYFKQIAISRSSDNGLSWSAPQVVYTNGSTALTGTHSVLPHVALDSGGKAIVVWNSLDDLGGTIGDDWDILFTRSTDSGVTWSTPAALDPGAEVDPISVDFSPDVATDDAGSWVVMWSHYGLIQASRSNDAGAVWSLPASIPLSLGGQPHVVAIGDGEFVAVTAADIGSQMTRSADAGESWSTVGTFDYSGLDLPRVATDGSHTWVVVWYSNDDLGGSIGNDHDILFVSSDTDSDGLSDGFEIGYGTDPYSSDTDGDGLFDGDELGRYSTSPLLEDTDGDGLADGVEVLTYLTDPLLVDTDEDGFGDGAEVYAGTNPLDDQSFPQSVPGLAWWASTLLGGFLALVGMRVAKRRGDSV